jgi:DNA-binding NtrC family response regulator
MADTMNFTGHGDCIPEMGNSTLPVLSVLYVDDEPLLLNVCKMYLERHQDICVSVASSVENALKLIETLSFDVIISDYQMPGIDGIGFLKILNDKHCSVPFILFTGRGREEVMTEAINNGAIYYIQKGGHQRSPFAELDNKVREASRQSLAGDTVKEDRIIEQSVI